MVEGQTCASDHSERAPMELRSFPALGHPTCKRYTFPLDLFRGAAKYSLASGADVPGPKRSTEKFDRVEKFG
jgi:hypothetical protein